MKPDVENKRSVRLARNAVERMNVAMEQMTRAIEQAAEDSQEADQQWSRDHADAAWEEIEECAQQCLNAAETMRYQAASRQKP